MLHRLDLHFRVVLKGRLDPLESHDDLLLFLCQVPLRLLLGLHPLVVLFGNPLAREAVPLQQFLVLNVPQPILLLSVGNELVVSLDLGVHLRLVLRLEVFALLGLLPLDLRDLLFVALLLLLLLRKQVLVSPSVGLQLGAKLVPDFLNFFLVSHLFHAQLVLVVQLQLFHTLVQLFNPERLLVDVRLGHQDLLREVTRDFGHLSHPQLVLRVDHGDVVDEEAPVRGPGEEEVLVVAEAHALNRCAVAHVRRKLDAVQHRSRCLRAAFLVPSRGAHRRIDLWKQRRS
mmetsp:Transcript_11850/g.44119  ORF Transcript_11850/g.44119 Transcript_11850/m.44119 type:complete len:286 (-) Transcript_11850:2-859(-)